MSQKSGTARPTGSHRFTQKQGQYLAFIYVYAHMFHQPPAACADAGSGGRAERSCRLRAARRAQPGKSTVQSY
jgi:hypothetical protein